MINKKINIVKVYLFYFLKVYLIDNLNSKIILTFQKYYLKINK